MPPPPSSSALLHIFLVSLQFSQSPCPPLSPPHRSSKLLFHKGGRCIEISPQCRDWGENKPLAPQHFSQITHFISCHTSVLTPLQPLTSTPPFLLSLACAFLSLFLSLSPALEFPVKGQHNYSHRNVSVLVHKMRLIHAHTLTHLHTRIAKYAHKGVHKMCSPFYSFSCLYNCPPLTQFWPPTHTCLVRSYT